MNPFRIQFELKKRGITQKQIAVEEGKSEMAVSKVIYKRMVSNRLMRAVAQKIEKDPISVFPEYFLSESKQTKAT